MITESTAGINVFVECVYQPEYSNADNMHFMFAYRITIENTTDYTAQLISRHWEIFDSIGDHKQIDGEGVVGEQPSIEPGQSHQYVSGCNLKSEMGYMQGYYTMVREVDGKEFNVNIPRFNLIASFRLN